MTVIARHGALRMMTHEGRLHCFLIIKFAFIVRDNILINFVISIQINKEWIFHLSVWLSS